MSVKEEKRKKKFGLGIIDIIIIICVVAGVLVAFKFAMVSDASTVKGQQKLTFTLEIQNKDASFVNNIKTGEKLFENLKGIYIGDITDISIQPYSEPAIDEATMTRKTAQIAGRYNIYVTVSTYADVSPGTTLVNDIEIQVGKKLFVRSKSFAASTFCVEMNFGGETND